MNARKKKGKCKLQLISLVFWNFFSGKNVHFISLFIYWKCFVIASTPHKKFCNVWICTHSIHFLKSFHVSVVTSGIKAHQSNHIQFAKQFHTEQMPSFTLYHVLWNFSLLEVKLWTNKKEEVTTPLPEHNLPQAAVHSISLAAMNIHAAQEKTNPPVWTQYC